MRYSAKLWLRLEAKQMETIDRFRVSSKRKTLTEAIRHLIQKGLELETARFAKEKQVGTLSVLYDCGSEGLARELAAIQVQAGDVILSKTRLCLDSRCCLKVLAIKGTRKRIRGLLNRLQVLAGVRHAWFSECQGNVINTKGMRKALASALAESGWVWVQRDMVLTMPFILTCGAERLWRQLLDFHPDGQDIAVSFSVHLNRDAFMHVALFKKPACANVSMFSLSPGNRLAPSAVDTLRLVARSDREPIRIAQ